MHACINIISLMKCRMMTASIVWEREVRIAKQYLVCKLPLPLKVVALQMDMPESCVFVTRGVSVLALEGRRGVSPFIDQKHLDA